MSVDIDLLLDWAGLTVSLFNTISLLWLGLTVILNGRGRCRGRSSAAGAWLTGGGMLLGAMLFTSHSAILGKGIGHVSLGMDFWWWLSWGPAIAAPLAWYGAMLWYAGFYGRRAHPHRLWLIAVAALASVILLVVILANPLPSYSHVVVRALAPSPSIAGLPLLIPLYLGYLLLCYLLPLDLLRRTTPSTRPLAAVARRGARPWLVGVSVLLLLAGLVMSAAALWALRSTPPPTLSDPAAARTVKWFDLAVAGLIALAVTGLGRAIVGYAVFTGRTLPRHGFFRQWRSTVLLAAGLGTLMAGVLVIDLFPLYSLMLVGGLMILFHALYSWRFTAEREQFMDQLRPFVASLDLYDHLRTASPPDAAAAQTLFETLAHGVLGARSAALVPLGALATLAGPPLQYPAEGAPIRIPPVTDLAAWFLSPEARTVPAGETGAAWAVALRNERGLGGVLLLGEKVNGSPYTEEEIEIAQAGGERLLDTLAGAEMARLAMQLLRQRLAQVQVMESQGRRVLHDEILPQLHSAVLYLGSLAGQPAVQESVQALSTAHRQIAALMRDALPPLSQRLAQQGLAQALHGTVEQEHAGAFDGVTWQATAEAIEAAGQLPATAAEVVYYAAQELIRNAARYGRGGAEERPLHLVVSLERTGQELHLTVTDDGVGLPPGGPSGRDDAGSGCGLRFHSTMLAAVGGSLELEPLPAGGTRAAIRIQVEE